MPETIFTKSYLSPFGEMMLGSYSGKIVLCDWRFRKNYLSLTNKLLSNLNAKLEMRNTEELESLAQQLEEYFHKNRKSFDVHYNLVGTKFQLSVWRQLEKIPYGQTKSYSELAHMLNIKNGARAVAKANGSNILTLLIPCHRIIGSDGNLVGYAGGLSVKRGLLNLENPHRNGQLSFFVK